MTLLPPAVPRVAARHRRIRRGVAIAMLGTLLAGVVAVAVRRPTSNTRYRTATVAARTVQQTVAQVGTIEPVSQAAVAFPVAGTVATVDVHVGEEVQAGTQLASLDPTSLEVALNKAQATLDQAKLTLQKALTSASSSSSSATARQTTATTAARSPSSTGDSRLNAAKQSVVAAQGQVTADLAKSDKDLASAQQVCTALGRTVDSTTTTTTTTTVTPATTTTTVPVTTTTTVPATTTTTTSPTAAAARACYDGLDRALAAQKRASGSQTALASAAAALDSLLVQSSSATSGSATTTTVRSAPAASGTATSGAGSSPSSADLIADQKAVDAATAQLAVARQAVQQAALVSPLKGTVVAVGLSPGQSVSASSTTATIVVGGNGGYEATVMASVLDLTKVRVGQAAELVPDGPNATVPGRVVGIGLSGTAGAGGTTYPVTVSLTGDTSSLRNGAVGTVTIIIADAGDVLAVPTSAVNVDNGQYSVTVLEGTVARTQAVQIGAIGPTWTEIKQGLGAGETVVVADLERALPGSATAGSNGTTNVRQGSFGGAGGPPGGFAPPQG